MYKWALSVLTSRAFQSSLLRHVTITALSSVPNSPDPTTSENQSLLSTYNPDMLLYPTLDLLNHSPHTKNYWITDEHAFSIICEDDVKPGDEIFNCYGAKNNGQLLLSYGFAIEDNPHDAFPLKLPPQEYPMLDRLEALASASTLGTKSREPSRVPEAHDPSLTTFYIRRPPPDSNSSPIAPGYPIVSDTAASRALAGVPLALIARLTAVLLNERETAALPATLPNPTNTPRCLHVSTRATLALISLVLSRMRMERTRLATGLTNLATASPPTPQAERRHTAANTYMSGQARILESNIAALELGVIDLISNKALTLTRACNLLEPSAGATFKPALRVLAGSEGGTVAGLLGMVRKEEGEEDAWALLVGLVLLSDPTEGSQLQPSLLALGQSYQGDGDEETLRHVMRVVARIRERVGTGALTAGEALWERDEWADGAFVSRCVGIVQEETVAVTVNARELARVEGRAVDVDGERVEGAVVLVVA